MAYSPNNNLGISPAPNGGISPQKNNLHKMARTPNPNHPANIFDNHLFCLDSTAEDTVSRPYIPALPVMHSSASPRMNGAHARSVSLPHNSASPVYRSETPDSSFNYYRSQQYLDPRSSLSPPPHENSGNTTPGFETLDDLPEGFPDELFGRINSLPMAAANNLPTVNIPETEILAAGLVPNSAGSSGYLPSPRQTASPYSHPFSPKVTISRSPSGRRYCSPAVKVEHRSPDIHHQNIPYFNHRSSSSSSSGIAPDSTTIHRGDDGSWHGGIDPLHRDSEYLPFSLKEQEFEEVRRAKNADVEEWLHRSAMQLPRPSGGLALPKDTGRKRAKSLSDFRSSPAIIDGKVVVPGEADAAEDDDEDDLEDDDDSSVATLDSTYQEGSLDEPPENGIKQQPTSEEDIHMANLDEVEREQKERENDPSLHPRPGQFFSAHPWNDIVGPVSRGASMAHRNQPGSSNYAITKFLRYAENIETASRVATYGSSMTKGRRNSTGGLELLPGPLKRLSFGRDKDKEKEKEKKNGAATPRRPSIWGGFTSGIKRSLSNSGDKAKLDKSKLQSPTDNGRKRGSSFSGSSSPFMQGILGPTFGQPGEASGVAGAFAQMASPLMAAGAAANQAASTSPGVVGGVIERVRRSRSKSDLQRKHIFGVVTSLVGPALSGGSPSPSPPEQAPGNLVKKFTFGEETQKRGNADVQRLLSPDDAHTNRAPDDDEDMEDGDLSPLSARTPGGTKTQLPKHDIVPTLDGFVQNVRTLTPGLSGKLVDRIAHEQVKRFKKLVDHRHKHLAALKAGGTCSNGSKCRKVFGAIGVGSDGFVGVSGHKRGNNSFDAGDDFDSSDENEHSSTGDGNVAAAQFPPGVPTPPVSRLPAEFECPICFKTKRFNKPSDWTKHVHEDVQPFTCTFPTCTEPKSFKRKADWVRHENELHRHLEWWQCNQPDCAHMCYRKDNFVQHLVREHKMSEPKIKTKKGGGGGAEAERVWQIVDSCHCKRPDHPSSEKCRFCGAACSTWKKLTVHLARHMEAISLPVLELIRDDAVVPAARRARGPAHLHDDAPVYTPPPQQEYHSVNVNVQLPTYNLTPPQHNASHQRSRSYDPGFYTPEQTYQYAPPPTSYPAQVYNHPPAFDGPGASGFQYMGQEEYAFVPTSMAQGEPYAVYAQQQQEEQYGFALTQGGVS